MSTAPTPIVGTAEQIAGRIRDEIEAGAIVPGQALSQVDLARAFGLSRIPIREALRALEAEGYVTSRPNKGTSVVAAPTLDDIYETIEIREMIESRIMERAVERVTPETLRAAKAALRALNAARHPLELRGAHERFHTILFDVAERPRMVKLINAWRFRLDAHPDVDGTKRQAFAAAVAGIHENILTACRHHDPALALTCVAKEYAYIRSIAPTIAAV
jgi:DNA-binding GntR family transcriptional regulator